LNSVEWTLAGLIVFALLLGVAIATLDQFTIGLAAGWAFCQTFWTYWITYYKEEV